MDTKTAILVFVLSSAVDEGSTQYVLSRSGMEHGGIVGPMSTKVRIGVKVGLLPGYLVLQKRSKLARWGLPVMFVAAGAWNVHQVRKAKR